MTEYGSAEVASRNVVHGDETGGSGEGKTIAGWAEQFHGQSAEDIVGSAAKTGN